jgi:hypothetical protein
MIKSMEKLKVRIDQNLNRSEKSVALPLELLQIGEVLVITKILYLLFVQRRQSRPTARCARPCTRRSLRACREVGRELMASLLSAGSRRLWTSAWARV